jgi:hypothetical protein
MAIYHSAVWPVSNLIVTDDLSCPSICAYLPHLPRAAVIKITFLGVRLAIDDATVQRVSPPPSFASKH